MSPEPEGAATAPETSPGSEQKRMKKDQGKRLRRKDLELAASIRVLIRETTAATAAAAATPTPISTLPGAPVGGTGIAAGQQAYEKLILEKGSQIIDCDVDFTSKRPYVSTDVGAKTYKDWVEQAHHVEAR